MSQTCPKGHVSSDPDYCSECGARMTPPVLPAATLVTTQAQTIVSGGELCPDCSTVRVAGSRFCEVCRYDFTPPAKGSSAVGGGAKGAPPLVPPPPTPVIPVSVPPPAVVSAPPPVPVVAPPPVPTAASPAAPAEPLNVIVVTDPTLVEEPDPATPFPVGAPDRLFPVDLAENLIGRRSERKGIFPEVEIADPGVSHRHLKLLRQPDGSLVAIELGSANGTKFNGALMTAGVPVPVKAGDEFTLGIWTRLKLQARG